MKVLIVCSGDWLERWASFIEAINSLNNLTLTVATTEGNKFSLDRLNNFSENGIEVIVLKSLPGKYTGFDASTIYGRGIKRIVKQNYDIVHFIAEPSYIAVYQFISILKSHQVHSIITIRAAQNVLKKFPVPFNLIEQYTYKNVDCIIPLFEEQGEILINKGYRGNLSYIENGYDSKMFYPDEKKNIKNNINSEFIFGFIGYFENYKGIYTLLEAVNQIKDENFKVYMIARGKEKDNFIKKVEEYKLRDKFVINDLVPQKKLPEFINSIDALVLPSEEAYYLGNPKLKYFPGYKPQLIKEQFGRVLVESMGSKKLVIGSDCGGIPRVIDNAGLIFNQKNSAQLAQLMKKVIEDRDLTINLQNKAYQRAITNYTWENIATKYYQLWSDLIKSRGN